MCLLDQRKSPEPRRSLLKHTLLARDYVSTIYTSINSHSDFFRLLARSSLKNPCHDPVPICLSFCHSLKEKVRLRNEQQLNQLLPEVVAADCFPQRYFWPENWSFTDTFRKREAFWGIFVLRWSFLCIACGCTMWFNGWWLFHYRHLAMARGEFHATSGLTLNCRPWN